MLNQGNIDINVFHLFNTVHNPMKSRSLLKLLKESQGNQKYYNWDFRQNYMYITFLKRFEHCFESYQMRKNVRVFSKISTLLKTRTSAQIKSHHQKMMKKNITISNVILYLEVKINNFLQLNPELKMQLSRLNEECEEYFRKDEKLRNICILKDQNDLSIIKIQNEIKMQNMNEQQEMNKYAEMKQTQSLDVKIQQFPEIILFNN